MWNKPIAYFLTFTTYGTWLHGDPRKSIVIRNHATEQIEGSDAFLRHGETHLKHAPFTMDADCRKIVLETICTHCALKKWTLFAVHVRSNHVHVVAASNVPPGKVLADLKAWCTRRLRQSGCDQMKFWTKHGSTLYIFNHVNLREKVRYTAFEQGEPMDYYISEEGRRMICV
jgi:hypothetical protein